MATPHVKGLEMTAVCGLCVAFTNTNGLCVAFTEAGSLKICIWSFQGRAVCWRESCRMYCHDVHVLRTVAGAVRMHTVCFSPQSLLATTPKP